MEILKSLERGEYWRNIIYDIINQEGFDPWDIDVGGLADSYMKKIGEMKMIDFEVPGTVVLVGAVLLKMKSDVVSGETFSFEARLAVGGEIETDSMEITEAESREADFDGVVVSSLQPLPQTIEEPRLLVRRIPKRKVTLPELMVFLKRIVMEAEKKEVIRRRRDEQRLEVHINKKNLQRVMREVYRQILRAGKGKGTPFRELVGEWKREAIVAYLIPILHLSCKNKVEIEQKEMFGEILVSAK